MRRQRQAFTSQATGTLESITSLISYWAGGDPLNVSIYNKSGSSLVQSWERLHFRSPLSLPTLLITRRPN